jgi:predicted ATPase/DNA-binding SARP family transcriptional activator
MRRPAVATLDIHLFGYPRVEHEAAPIGIRRRKALALLAYLVTSDSDHGRDALAALLWPESEPAKAYAFLRNALWILNQTPLSDWLVVTRHTVGLRQDALIWIDAVEFKESVKVTRGAADPPTQLTAQDVVRLTRAVDLFQNDFLAGFSVEDSYAFEEWQFAETQSLRQDLSGALEALVTHHQDRGELEAAIRFASRWLAVQPLNETVHRRLIELYARSGQRAAALRQFEECRKTLDEELGLNPSAETISVAESVRSGEIPSEKLVQSTAPSLLNFPNYRTPFIGREGELGQIENLLQQSDCRLLTVTGPGGSGKTRLVIASAEHCASSFPHGVAFVPLTPVVASESIPTEIAEAVGASFYRDAHEPEGSSDGPTTSLDELLDFLRHRRMLLVLDSVEHLVANLGSIETLIEHTRGITIVATSRQQLNLRGEWIFPIEGLPFPEESVSAADLSGYDAVSLFLRTARQANVSFSPTDNDWRAIARIARLLEGIPLGIELAAAGVRTATCDEIADEIEKSVGFLSTRLRYVPKRHRSLRALFEQSWALLPRDGRAAFRRLSVFRGGFSREAAEEVTEVNLPVLSSLLARSLLRRSPLGRYEMLEILREFAAERLRALPHEHRLMRDTHGAYYLSLLAENEHSLKGPGQKESARRLTTDIENIRAAWHHAVETRNAELLRRAAFSLFLYCDMRNHFDEGAELFGAASTAFAEATEEDLRRLYAFSRGLEAWFTHARGGQGAGETLFDDSLRILEALPEGRQLAFIQLLAAFARHGSADEARRRLSDSLEFFERAQLPWEAAETLEALSWHLLAEDADDAVSHAARSVEMHAQLRDPWGMAMAKFALGIAYTQAGQRDRAQAQFEESLALRRDLEQDPLGTLQCLVQLGHLANERRDSAQAVDQYEAALHIAQGNGTRWAQARVHAYLAQAFHNIGTDAESAEHAQRAVSLYRALGREQDAARCKSLLHSLRPSQDEPSPTP